MAFWADDAQYFEHPSKLLANGASEIRERHIIRFKEPDLYGRLIHRMAVGNKVVDQEIVTRNFPDGPGRADVIAIYEVERGKIAETWFIIGTPNPMTGLDAAEFRLGVATDAAAIGDLTREAYAKWVPLIGREPKPMTANYEEAVRKHRLDLLHVKGLLAALIETIPAVDHLLIENVAVSPAFQRRGFGRKLMAHAELVAASFGFSEIRLYTNKVFAENVRFYAQLGYRLDQEEAFEGGVLIHMSKSV